MKQINVPTKHF